MADENRVAEPRVFQESLPEEQLRELSTVVRALLQGKSNNYFNVELTPDETTTVVLVEYARVGGIANFHATSQGAATAISEGVVWTTVENGNFTVHHDSSSAAGRTLGVTLVG